MTHDPYAALKFKDYRLLFFARLASTMALQMQSVAIGWELYERTHSALDLGYIGLVQFIPVLLFALPAGHFADRIDRRKIFLITQAILLICSLGLGVLSYTQGTIPLIFLCLFLDGLARGFNTPASAALMPALVPIELIGNASVWNSSMFQIASVVGPALGGLSIAWFSSATNVYWIDAILLLASFVFAWFIQHRDNEREPEGQSIKSIGAGLSFLKNTKVILAAITLDMFAVLLGGVTTLMPIFAKDILQVGPSGLGWLRAAPSLGALLMAFIQAYRPPLKKAGQTLFWVVIGFGLTTIVFGLSKLFWLSMAMLVLNGALDNVSMVIRMTLVQIWTPDMLRGRVSAINNVFIGSSNELGGFESGLVAALFGPVISAVSGGIGTILVVILIGLIWPELIRLRSLEEGPPQTNKPVSVA